MPAQHTFVEFFPALLFVGRISVVAAAATGLEGSSLRHTMVLEVPRQANSSCSVIRLEELCTVPLVPLEQFLECSHLIPRDLRSTCVVWQFVVVLGH